MELAAVQAKARRIRLEVVEPNAEQWDRDATWPEPAVRALQGAGLGGLVVPRAHGGLGHGMEALARVCETLGWADASTALCFGMHSVATACLVAKATADHQQHLLGPIASGHHWTTLALSEAGTGSHFYLPQTTARQVDEHYELRGGKCFVTNGGHADSYVVSVVDGSSSALGHFSMLVVPAAATSGRWGEPWQGWGMRGNSSIPVNLDGVRVPTSNRLGEEGDQIWYVFNVVAPYFLVAMAGTYLGVASRALEEAVQHLKTRFYAHTGQTLAETDVLQHRVGRLWAEVERARRLCYFAAKEADSGGPDAIPALCAAKAEVGATAVNVTNECLTLMGGKGYHATSVVSRLLRDARAAHVMSPTTDILYTWTGRALLDLPLLGK